MGGNWTIDWSKRGTNHPYFGSFCILFAFLTIPLYLMCTQVIWTMRKIDTYKVKFHSKIKLIESTPTIVRFQILLWLAVSDILALVLNSFTFGIFLIMVNNHSYREN